MRSRVIITRTGARTPSVVGAAGMLVLAPVCALATTPLALVGCLLALGVAQGLLFGPMLSLLQAARVVRLRAWAPGTGELPCAGTGWSWRGAGATCSSFHVGRP